MKTIIFFAERFVVEGGELKPVLRNCLAHPKKENKSIFFGWLCFLNPLMRLLLAEQLCESQELTLSHRDKKTTN